MGINFKVIPIQNNEMSHYSFSPIEFLKNHKTMKAKYFVILLIFSICIFSIFRLRKNNSTELLNTLISLNTALNLSNNRINIQSQYALDRITQKAENRREEVGPIYQRASRVKNLSNEFVEFLENLKTKLIKEVSIKTNTFGEDELNILLTNNKDVHQGYFFMNKGNEKAKELKKMVDSTRYKLLDLLREDEDVRIYSEERIRISSHPFLLTKYDSINYSSWAEMNFRFSSIGEAILALTKLQNDCRNLEAEILDLFYKSINNPICFFRQMEARIICNSNTIMVGTQYRAEVILLSPDIQIFKVFVNGKSLPMEDNVGIYINKPTIPGVYKWGGYVQVIENGALIDYPFEAEYIVLDGGSMISSRNSDILFIGIENNLNISLPGFRSQDLIASTTNGQLKLRGDHWYIKVKDKGNATVSVSVRMRDGTIRKMIEHSFRTRILFPPKSTFGSIENGEHSKVELLEQNLINAAPVDINPYILKSQIQKYTFNFYPLNGKPKHVEQANNEITTEIKEIISNGNSGDKIVIDKIFASGPNGVLELNPIVLNLL